MPAFKLELFTWRPWKTQTTKDSLEPFNIDPEVTVNKLAMGNNNGYTILQLWKNLNTVIMAD